MFDTSTNWYAKNPQYFQETRMMQEHIMKRIPPDPSDQSDFLQQDNSYVWNVSEAFDVIITI